MKNYNISITKKCNLNCIYCYPEIKKKTNAPKGLREIKKEIIKANKEGYSNINFGDAESTLSPNLVNLIKFCRTKNLTTSITTNGVTLSNEDFLNKLVSAGLSKIEFTFNSADDEINENICQRKGVAKHQIKALENIQNHNIFLSVFTVISELNYRALETHAEFIINRFNIDQFSFIYVITKRKGNPLLPRYSESEKHIIKSLDVLNQVISKVQLGNIPLCFLKKNQYYKKTFEYKGVPSCPDPDLKKIIHKNCLKCTLRDKCKGVNISYYNVHGINELEGRGFK